MELEIVQDARDQTQVSRMQGRHPIYGTVFLVLGLLTFINFKFLSSNPRNSLWPALIMFGVLFWLYLPCSGLLPTSAFRDQSLLAVLLWEPNVMLGMKPRLCACKASDLTTLRFSFETSLLAMPLN